MSNISKKILFEDNHLLVLNKPRNLSVQQENPEGPSVWQSAKDYLKKQYAKPGDAYLGMVHRLDRNTSGVLVFAKTSKAASRLSAQFRDRKIKKSYMAWLEGVPENSQGELSHHLKKANRQSKPVPKGTPGAHLAQLRYCVLKQRAGNTLVRIELITGFYHQIRCQFANLGTPLRGDVPYGGSPWKHTRGYLLHCQELSFTHPTLKEPVSFRAPLPDVWAMQNIAQKED
jgi:23S rRNA pseudouridine1911/1915/1917 synthase